MSLWPHRKVADVDLFAIGRRNTDGLKTPMAARYEDTCTRCGITIAYVAYGGPDLNPKQCSYCEE